MIIVWEALPKRDHTRSAGLAHLRKQEPMSQRQSPKFSKFLVQ